jgi:hypothetical protein
VRHAFSERPLEATKFGAKMTPFACVFLLKSEFDDFLFAPIGEDGNGTLLSVLSALVRLDLDPWQEAAELAQLPGEPATQRLASLIAALPDGSTVHLDPGTAAARLIALLPGHARSNIRSRETLLGVGEVMSFRAAAIYVIFIFVVLGGLTLSTHLPPGQVDTAQTMAPSTVSSHTLPPSFDQ